ncbi:beta-propeller fold lactonase family protein, partial [Bacillus cereus]|nr:beta-propeller fold lactonase family protein [Bacillus cereus]
SVINTGSNSVVATVSVGTNPRSVAITPDGDFAYVTNSSSNNVSVINTGSNSVVATIPVGNAPTDVAITPDGDFAYVTNFNSNNVSVINTGSNSVVATIPVGNTPTAVAITPDGDFAYVTNRDIGNVSVINTGSNSVVATIPVGIGPIEVAIGSESGPFEPTKNNATIARENNVAVANNTAIPLATNVVINGTDIIHSPGSTDITLGPNHTYYVYYSVAGLNLIAQSFVTQLFLGGVGVVGSLSASVSGVSIGQQLTNTQAVIINTGIAPSILQLRNISGGSRNVAHVTVTIIELM